MIICKVLILILAKIQERTINFLLLTSYTLFNNYMRSIRNNKYWLENYFVLLICILIIAGLLVVPLKLNSPKGRIFFKLSLLIPYSIFIFFMFKKLLFSYKIDISNDGILLTTKNERKQIKWSEISAVEYFSKTDFSGLPSIQIDLKNSKKPIFLNHSHYSNSGYLTQAIKYCYDSFSKNEDFDLKSTTPVRIESISNKQTQFEQFEYINRSPLTTIRSYMPIVGVWGIYKILTADFVPLAGIIASCVISSLFLFVGVFGIGKIGISDKYLTIENFYFPIQKAYRLIDINEIFIENPGGKSPNLIRIITNDYNHKSFRLANFIKKDWIQTENILKGKGMTVHNKLYK